MRGQLRIGGSRSIGRCHHCGARRESQPCDRRVIIGKLLATYILPLEALVTGPCLNQSAVHREVLSGEQIPAAGLSQHLGKERVANRVPKAARGCYVPYGVVQVESDEPAKLRL